MANNRNRFRRNQTRRIDFETEPKVMKKFIKRECKKIIKNLNKRMSERVDKVRNIVGIMDLTVIRMKKAYLEGKRADSRVNQAVRDTIEAIIIYINQSMKTNKEHKQKLTQLLEQLKSLGKPPPCEIIVLE